MTEVMKPGFMADEDMQILMAIALSLKTRFGDFTINLPNGVKFTSENNQPPFSFAGIDHIKNTLDKLMLNAGDAKWTLIMPTNRFNERKEIGRLFDIPVFADPDIPKDKFLIQEEQINGKS